METEQSTDLQTASGVPPPKFSRYRSVRKGATTSRAPPPPLPQPSSGVKRSMSRYRKARPSNAPATAPPLPTLPISKDERPRTGRNRHDGHNDATQSTQLPQSRTRRAYTMPKRSQTAPVGQEAGVSKSPASTGRTRAERKDTDRIPPESFEPPALFENAAQAEAYAILNGEQDRQKKLRQVQAEQERERRRIFEEEEQMRREEAENRERVRKEETLELEEAKAVEELAARVKRQAEKEARQASSKSPRRQRTPPDSHMQDYRDFSSPEKVHATPDTAVYSSAHALRPGDGPPKLKRAEDKPPQIPVGFDAPISAVNAGTRKVLIKFNDATVEVSVTPESTPADLLSSAVDDLSDKIDPSRSIVAESFKQVGLERPLRRYEHIRDVMNSWDHDDQNAFLILPAEVGEGAALEVKDAPSDQPEEISVYMYYSNKPGSWDKRWITLRSDGQVLVSKQPGVDQKNICHMTDFDIYIPTSKRIKKIKPPKKYCFAIKSQQKSAMFLSAANFVHFLSTKDKEQASAWYSAVQSWRSWYLVHEMGQGSRKSGTIAAATTSAPEMRQYSNSNESKPHQLGSFKPFLSDDIFDKTPNAPSSRRTEPSQPFTTRGAPPVSLPKKLTKEHTPAPNIITSNAPAPASADPFTSSGLLGRTYTKRQQRLQDRADPSHEQPPSPLPTHQPLINLTPKHKDLPHHLHKGRGIIPDQIPSGGLVNMATGRDEIYASPTALFHPIAPVVPTVPASAPVALPHRSGTVRTTRTTRAKASTAPSGPSAPSVPLVPSNGIFAKPGAEGVPDLPAHPTANAFTGTGLLATAAADEGVGAGRVGRGVASGDRRATEPLIEVGEGPTYVKGSLLDGVERWEESEGVREKVVVDRGRGRSEVVRVGEGL